MTCSGCGRTDAESLYKGNLCLLCVPDELWGLQLVPADGDFSPRKAKCCGSITCTCNSTKYDLDRNGQLLNSGVTNEQLREIGR